MKLRATQLGWKTAVAIAIASILTIAGCPQHADSAHDAACSPEALAALTELYKRAGVAVVRSGACDAYQRVESCPEYMMIETQFKLASKPWETCTNGR